MYCLLSFDGIDRDSKICHGYGFKTVEFIVGRCVFAPASPRWNPYKGGCMASLLTQGRGCNVTNVQIVTLVPVACYYAYIYDLNFLFTNVEASVFFGLSVFLCSQNITS